MAGSHIATFPVAQFGKSARSRGLARQDRTSSRGGSSSVLAPAPDGGEGLGQLRGPLRRALLTAGGSRFRGSEQESSIKFKAQLKGFGNLNGRGRMTSIAIAAFAWLF
jgi:hypothetical protein